MKPWNPPKMRIVLQYETQRREKERIKIQASFKHSSTFSKRTLKMPHKVPIFLLSGSYKTEYL